MSTQAPPPTDPIRLSTPPHDPWATTPPPPKPKRHLLRNILAAVGVALLALIVIGVLAGPDDPPAPTRVAASGERTDDLDLPPVEPTNGPTRDPEPTLEEPEPEPEPEPPAPSASAVAPEQVRDILAGTFATNPDTRAGFITDLENNLFTLDSVDDITYDPASGVVTVNATTLFGANVDGFFARNPEELQNLGWDFMRYIGQDVLGEALPGLEWDGDLNAAVPSFTLSVDGGQHTIACPGPFMLQLSQRTTDRDQFTTACQIA